MSNESQSFTLENLEEIMTLQDATTMADINDAVIEDTVDPVDPDNEPDPDDNDPDDPIDPVDPQDPDPADPNPQDPVTPVEGADDNKAYFDTLVETGYLVVSDDFEYDGTAEKLEEALKYSDEAKASAIKESIFGAIPDTAKPLIKHLAAGGSVQDYLDVYSELNPSKVDLTSVYDQKRIVSEYFRQTTKFDETKIEKLINKMMDLDTLQEDAETYLEELKEMEDNRASSLATQTEEAKRQREQANVDYQNTLSNAIDKSTLIPVKRRQKVKDFFFKQVLHDNKKTSNYNKVINEVSSNPEHLAQLADILLDYDADKGFVMDRFERRGKNQANKSFKKTLNQKLDPKSKVTGKTSHSKTQQIDWEALLNQH